MIGYFKRLRLKSLIITAGFLEGVWVSIGFSPEAFLMQEAAQFLTAHIKFVLFSFFLGILPTVLFMLTLYLIYSKGGLLGMLGVFLGFLGGLLILTHLIFSLAFIALALAIEPIATKSKSKKRKK